jgi:hypothetical protein
MKGQSGASNSEVPSHPQAPLLLLPLCGGRQCRSADVTELELLTAVDLGKVHGPTEQGVWGEKGEVSH